ncbi:MAG: SDR family oxidoreductase [Anaerolineales bacterium]|nr:SDR family oxidoreductase [Anaerolineales bacterium]
MANGRLAGKTAVVTGAAAGIGKSIAATFAREGALVVVADSDEQAGAAVAAEVSGTGFCRFVAVDIAVPDSVAALIETTVAHYGKLDIIVANAGIGGRSLGDGPVDQCTVEAWDRVMEVNLRGTFLTCKYALPALLECKGCILTISSVLGMVGTQGLFDTHAYATSKAGIIGLTRAIAAHYAQQGVRANVIAPGLVDTRMAKRTKSDPAIAEQVAFWQPIGGLGQPRDVADAALFLCSDEAKFITGAVLPVDGGWTVQ